jgi:transposase, IS30 family
MILMAERPAEVATRTVPDHWEDLIEGARNGSAVGTLVGQENQACGSLQMDWNGCEECPTGFTKTLRHVPALLRKTLPYDRGKEMAEHARLAERFAIRIFFADPYSPWQHAAPTRTRKAAAPVPAERHRLVGVHAA